jgi:Xaa-Pro aminopeptidase
MIRRFPQRPMLVVACLLFVVFGSAAQKSTPATEHLRISPDEYKQRRALLMSKMEPSSIAIFKAKDPSVRSNDVNYLYRQESNFLYLTGCDEPRAYLLLCPEGVQVDSVTTAKEVFFIRPKTRSASGESLGFEGAKEKLGFTIVLPVGDMPAFAKRVLAGKKVLYYHPSVPDLAYDPLMEKRMIISREVKNELQAAFPELEIKSLYSPLAEMRSVKSAAELALLQKAIDATAIAHIEAMKTSEPGMYEYELQAVIEYCYAKNGAEFPGFPSIVGSGPNSCILHYEANRRQMQDGDVVVMDIGAEYSGYTADITRTMPVNGKFSKPQREIYELVLKAQEEAIKEFKPGAPSSAPNAKGVEVIADGLMKLGLIKSKEEARTYYLHGLSHHIGLDVHDVGPYGKPYQPGMVLTVEPGIYIPAGSPCDRQYWNIGVRIEDDVLITESGNRVLTAAAPKSVKDIETLMQKKGIGNSAIGDR